MRTPSKQELYINVNAAFSAFKYVGAWESHYPSRSSSTFDPPTFLSLSLSYSPQTTSEKVTTQQRPRRAITGAYNAREHIAQQRQQKKMWKRNSGGGGGGSENALQQFEASKNDKLAFLRGNPREREGGGWGPFTAAAAHHHLAGLLFAAGSAAAGK